MSLPAAKSMTELKRRARRAAAAVEGAKAVMDSRYGADVAKQEAARYGWLCEAANSLAWIDGHLREIRDGVRAELDVIESRRNKNGGVS